MRILAGHRTLLETIQSPFVGHVSGMYTGAINLIGPVCGQVWSLAALGAEDDPFLLITDCEDMAALPLRAGQPVQMSKGRMKLGPLALDCTAARAYDTPVVKPGWMIPAMERGLDAAQGILGKTPANTPANTHASQVLFQKRKTAMLTALMSDDLDNALVMGKNLVGLGPGLTPSGDDWLAALAHIAALEGSPLACYRPILGEIVSFSQANTSQMGHAVLLRAMEGYQAQCVARVIVAITGGQKVEPAARALLAYGHTSGRDTLLGLVDAIQLSLRLLRRTGAAPRGRENPPPGRAQLCKTTA